MELRAEQRVLFAQSIGYPEKVSPASADEITSPQ
jgi:hypothetical protein